MTLSAPDCQKPIYLPYVQDDIGYFNIIKELGMDNIEREVIKSISKGIPVVTFMRIGWNKPKRMEIKITLDAVWLYWLGT